MNPGLDRDSLGLGLGLDRHAAPMLAQRKKREQKEVGGAKKKEKKKKKKKKKRKLSNKKNMETWKKNKMLALMGVNAFYAFAKAAVGH